MRYLFMAYTNNVTGWFNKKEFAILEILAKSVPSNGSIIEIGSHFGRTTVAWADTLCTTASIYAIDTWSYMEPDEQFLSMEDIDKLPMTYKESMASRFEVFEYFTKNYNNITPVHAHSPRSFQQYPNLLKVIPPAADLIFVDAIHENPWFADDLTYWYPRLKNGGTLCGHDFSSWFPDIITTVRSFAKEHKLHLCEPAPGCTVWWMRDPAYI